MDKSPAKEDRSADEKPKEEVEDAAESQRNLKVAQHKQWLESVK